MRKTDWRSHLNYKETQNIWENEIKEQFMP